VDAPGRGLRRRSAFCHLGVCVAWWRHFRARRVVVADSLFVHVVRDGSRLVAVAPFMLTCRPGHRLGVRTIEFMGADPNITEIRRVLCDPHAEAAVYRALTMHLHQRRHEWDCIHWRGIVAGSDAESVLVDETGVRFTGLDMSNFVLPLTDDWDTFKATRPRNVKESLRRCYNSLTRDGHRFDFEVVSAPVDVVGALDDFFRLHRARSIDRNGVAHRDVFDTVPARQFLLEVCSRLAARGKLRIFRLRINGAVVATRIGFVEGSCLYLYYSGHDPSWSKYSVMTTTVAEAVRYAIAGGMSSVNLSTGAGRRLGVI
jgi:CelD/BcsL family acetyltransferase involved in cellulose biosynthesis